MPADTDKHAAAQQAVDILHEISTILVGQPLESPPAHKHSCSRDAELPPGPSYTIHLHLDD